MTHALWWVIVAIVLGLIEMATVDLVFLMLAIGGLAAALTSLVVPGFWPEVGVFVVCSLVFLCALRPWLKMRMLWSQTNVKTNVHALIGRQVDVIETVNASSGRVKLDGEVWSARTIDEKPLLVGEHAYVCEIDGATAVVTSVENRSKSFEEQKG